MAPRGGIRELRAARLIELQLNPNESSLEIFMSVVGLFLPLLEQSGVFVHPSFEPNGPNHATENRRAERRNNRRVNHGE